ncbi:metalloprotease family protein [Lysinibacillus sp. NPDC094403]|uniref:metalloprotease family protein n=1 Tax=Lysinibacillus sp. NPDC094403 TaxID=3390581 RepID=UPI003D075EB7
MISIGVINIYSGISLSDFGFTSGALSITINFGIIWGIVLLLILHELLHLMFIPNFIKSEKTSVGLTLFGGFVITEEEISKSRYLFITIIILSIIFPLILSVFGLLTTTLKFLIILNSMGSSVDLLNLLLIMKQVPKNATLTSNGANTYWKKAQTEQKG